MDWTQTSTRIRCASSSAGSRRPPRRRGARGGRARDRDARRAPVGADGAAEARGRARLRLLHELREPEGRRAGGQPACGAPLPLAGRSGGRCGSRAESSGSTAAESEAYFRTRPLGSRLAAWASPQSRPLADRAELERPLRRCGRALPARTCRYRRTGAASGSSRTRTSSGSTATTGCTTAFATSATRAGWRRARLAP